MLLDENVPFGVGAWMRTLEHPFRVDHVYDLGFKAHSDESLYAWAEENAAIIVTHDEDFADRRRFPTGGACGVVRLKIDPTDQANTCAALQRVLDAFTLDQLRGKLAIVDARRVRVIG